MKFLKKFVHLFCNCFMRNIRHENEKFISAKTAGNAMSCVLGEHIAQKFQCPVSGGVAIDPFEIIHIKEDQATIMFLHKFRGETFTEAPHGKPCEKIVILGIGLCLDSSYYIRDELADGKLHIRKIVGIRIF